jgi:hypothetical protein
MSLWAELTLLEVDRTVLMGRSDIMKRLISHCCSELRYRGMSGAFVSGLRSSECGLESLGKACGSKIATEF